MTTATVILDLGLAAGASAVVTTAMIIVPNIERIRFYSQHQRIREPRRTQERLFQGCNPTCEASARSGRHIRAPQMSWAASEALGGGPDESARLNPSEADPRS